jgi:predicted DNA-binding transcriptional regulator AlpA
MTVEKQFLTVAELASILSVSEKAVRIWTQNGAMPGVVRIGRRCLRYRTATIEKAITSGQLLIERNRNGCRIMTAEKQMEEGAAFYSQLPWVKKSGA